MATILKAYGSLLQRRPYAAQSATAAFLFGAGDVLAQQGVEKAGMKNHDWARTARLTFYGGALFGPAMTKWYTFLGRLRFKSETRGIVWRVYLDQFVLTPVAVSFFFGAMATLEGKPMEAPERIKNAYVPTVLRNWGVFIPTQIINFAFVPPHLRFLVVSVVSLFWNTYLSVANAQQKSLEAGDIVAEVDDLKTKVVEKISS